MQKIILFPLLLIFNYMGLADKYENSPKKYGDTIHFAQWFKTTMPTISQGNRAISIQDFTLRNIDNSTVSLANYKEAKGFIVVFTCNHCPFAKLYTQRLNDLNTKYQAVGVPLLAINSMDTLVYEDETFELMQKKAKSEKYTFPYLQDAMQSVGKNFGATHTPQAFIIWRENNAWAVKYQGPIDDNGEHPKKAHSYIDAALAELLENKTVANPDIPSFGCRIYYRK